MSNGWTKLIGPHLAELRSELATILCLRPRRVQAEAAKIGHNLKVPIAQLAASIEQFPSSMAAFQQGAEAIGRVATELEIVEAAGEAMKQGAAYCRGSRRLDSEPYPIRNLRTSNADSIAPHWQSKAFPSRGPRPTRSRAAPPKSNSPER